MAAQLDASLKRLGLIEIPASTGQARRFAIEGVLAFTRPDGAAAPVADLLLGAGNAPDPSAFLDSANPFDQSLRQRALSEGKAVWLGTGLDAAVTNGCPDRPVWFALLAEAGIEVLGIQPLSAGGPLLQTAGVLECSAGAVLKTRLRLRGDALELAEFSLSGALVFKGDLGPVSLKNLTGTFLLNLSVAGRVPLWSLLADPAAILDGAFSGELKASIETSGSVTAFGSTLTGAQTITLQAAVRSEEGTRDLTIDSASYTHHVSGMVSLAPGVELATTGLKLAAEVAGWSAQGFDALEFRGAAEVVAPGFVQPALAPGRSAFSGDVLIQARRAGTAYKTRIEVALKGAALAPEANPLGITSGRLRLVLHDEAGTWTALLEAEVTQSWEDLARQMHRAGIALLPHVERLPDVRCRLEIAAGAAGSTALRILAGLRQPGSAEPYSGRLGAFPVWIGDCELRFVAALSSGLWTWRAEGEAKVSTLGPLANLVRLSHTACAFSLASPAADQTIPELTLSIAGGLPPLELPAFQKGRPALRILEVQQLTLRLGEEVRALLRVRLLPNLSGLAAAAHIPAAWDELFGPLLAAVRGSAGELSFSLSREGSCRLLVRLAAGPHVQPFDPLGALATIAPWTPGGGAGASTPTAPLLTIKPDELRFAAEFPANGEPALELSASVECSVLGEVFDATLTFAVRQGIPEVLLRAANRDPIYVPIRAPGPNEMAAQIQTEVARVLGLYNVAAGAEADKLQGVADQLRWILGEPSSDVLLAFEIRDLAIALRAEPNRDPFSVSGGVRLAQYPPVLDVLLGSPPPTLKLGSSGTSFFIEMAAASATPEPLVSFPIADRGRLEVVLHNLRIGYTWEPPAVQFALNSEIRCPRLPFQGGVAVVPPPVSAMDVDFLMTTTTPPAPMPRWRLDFLGGDQRPENRGLELVFGQSDTDRYLTIYLRKTIFSPAFHLCMPGLELDAGAYLGAPPSTRSDNKFHCEFRAGGWQAVTISPYVGLLVNPLAALPVGSPLPPYWLVPPTMMVDYFTDPSANTGLELDANIPGLLAFRAVLKRPLPTLSLQMLLEVAMLAIQDFAVELPPNSSLRKLLYVSLSGEVHLRLLSTFFGSSTGPIPLHLEFNVVDLINTLLCLFQQARAAIHAGAQAATDAAAMFQAALNDPSQIVRAIPRQARTFSEDTTLSALGLGLSCHASAYLLLPEELEAELMAFHENKRRRGKGLAALRESVPGPGGPQQVMMWEEDEVIVRQRVSNLPDVVRKAASAPVFSKAEEELAGDAAGALERAEQAALTAFANQLAREMLDQPDAHERNQLLARCGAGRLAQDIEAILRGPGSAGMKLLRIRDRLRPALDRELGRFSVQLAERLPDEPEALARKLVDDCIQVQPATRLPGELLRRVALKADRREPIAAVLGAGRLVQGVDQWLAGKLARPLVFRPHQIDPWKQSLTVELKETIERLRVIGREGNLEARNLRDGLKRVAANLFEPAPAPVFEAVPEPRAKYRARICRDGLREFLALYHRGRPQRQPLGAEQNNGFVIRLRPSVRHLGPGFQVPVNSRFARFDVRLRGGTYAVVVARHGGETVTALPDAVVASIPLSPERPRRLRGLLMIDEDRSGRPLTPAEQRYLDDDPEVTIPGLYQNSLLYRQEYKIRDDGGRYGPTYLADLLRAPDGAYLVPNGPCAVAGVKVTLAPNEWEVNLCGYAALDGGTPALLLFGHGAHALTFGAFQLVVEGDFHVLAGRTSDLVLSSGQRIQPGARFVGFGALRHHGQTLAAGSAEAKLCPAVARRAGLELKLTTHLRYSPPEIAIGEIKLLKLRLEQDLELTVQAGSDLKAAFDGNIALYYQTGEIAQETITVRGQVCVTIPLTGIELCSPEVDMTVKVPKLTETVWGPERSIAARLKIGLDTSAGNPRFAASCSVDFSAIPGLNLLPNPYTFEIPDLITVLG